MANITFDSVDLLATCGFSLLSLNGRALAPWPDDIVQVPGSDLLLDLGTNFDRSQTLIGGMISADTTPPMTNYTHAVLMSRLDALKAAVDPRKGYKKLIVADQTDRFRFCRFKEMAYEESTGKPVLKLPHQVIAMTFENLEPYWRKTHTDVTISTTTGSVPNGGKADVRPVIDITMSGTIVATSGPVVSPVTLFDLDDLQVRWKGLSTQTDGTLSSGNVLRIDAAALTAIKNPAGTPIDVIRHYDSGGPGAFAGNGFPLIKVGGSALSNKHANISSIVFKYDEYYL